jgi:cell division protein FtsL
VIQPTYFEPSRVRNPRTARAATQRRIVHKSRARYSNIVRVSMGLAVLLALLMGYVLLTSTMTGLSYTVAKAKHEREALQEETMRLDDRIAVLRSDERLSALAAKLGMKDPQRFALVRTGVPHVADSGRHFAVLSSLAGFFMPAVTRPR